MNEFYVFEEWCDYDGGGMKMDVFSNKRELKDFLNKECQDKSEEEAQSYLKKIVVIEGQKRNPRAKEVVKRIAVEI